MKNTIVVNDFNGAAMIVLNNSEKFAYIFFNYIRVGFEVSRENCTLYPEYIRNKYIRKHYKGCCTFKTYSKNKTKRLFTLLETI